MPLYFITYTIIFWIPVALFLFFFYRKLSLERRKAFWITTAIMAVISVIMEYFYLKFDTWSFSEEIDPLLGLWFGKAPVEEYVYWFGATPFCLSVYLVYLKYMKAETNG